MCHGTNQTVRLIRLIKNQIKTKWMQSNVKIKLNAGHTWKQDKQSAGLEGASHIYRVALKISKRKKLPARPLRTSDLKNKYTALLCVLGNPSLRSHLFVNHFCLSRLSVPSSQDCSSIVWKYYENEHFSIEILIVSKKKNQKICYKS